VPWMGAIGLKTKIAVTQTAIAEVFSLVQLKLKWPTRACDGTQQSVVPSTVST